MATEEPLYDDHQFKGEPGVLGGNCVVCHYPIMTPWHKPEGRETYVSRSR